MDIQAKMFLTELSFYKYMNESNCKDKECVRELGHSGFHFSSNDVQNESWRERFDSTFKLDDYGTSTAVQDKVKNFIASELFLKEKEVKENMIVEIKRLPNSYDGDEEAVFRTTKKEIIKIIRR